MGPPASRSPLDASPMTHAVAENKQLKVRKYRLPDPCFEIQHKSIFSGEEWHVARINRHLHGVDPIDTRRETGRAMSGSTQLLLAEFRRVVQPIVKFRTLRMEDDAPPPCRHP